jgi:hypothetical protein
VSRSCRFSSTAASAWIGLFPKQNSSGGKDKLGNISKRGDRYLRSLFTTGALAVIRYTRASWIDANAKPSTSIGFTSMFGNANRGSHTDILLARKNQSSIMHRGNASGLSIQA